MPVSVLSLIPTPGRPPYRLLSGSIATKEAHSPSRERLCQPRPCQQLCPSDRVSTALALVARHTWNVATSTAPRQHPSQYLRWQSQTQNGSFLDLPSFHFRFLSSSSLDLPPLYLGSQSCARSHLGSIRSASALRANVTLSDFPPPIPIFCPPEPVRC